MPRSTPPPRPPNRASFLRRLFSAMSMRLSCFLQEFFEPPLVSGVFGLVVPFTLELLWKICLLYEGILEVVGVEVIPAVAEVLHEFSGRVADMKRYGILRQIPHVRGRPAVAGVDGVALLCKGKVDARLGEGQVAFRSA